jgi:CBS domain-containing protein
MSVDPISIQADAFVAEAVVLLTERGFSAAPVIDEAGRPVGVVSRTDLLVHDREEGAPTACSAHEQESLGTGFQVKRIDSTRVADVMTPVVFCVAPDDSAEHVIAQMLSLNVHRLFVVDSDGVLVGVISGQDVLRFIRS